MKILHVADIHLGAKNGKLPKDKQDLMRDEMLDGVNRLFLSAGKEHDVVVICGDLFHSKNVSNKIVNNFLLTVGKYAKPVLYIDGNHDEKLILPENTPENFIVLNKENTKFSYNGFNFYSADNLIELDQSEHNILLLHGNVESTGDNDYVDINKFLAFNYDYIALGHIHQVKKYKKGKHVFAYSGSLFSNGFDECGDKGYLSVEVRDKQLLKCDFIPFPQRRYMICEYDISSDQSNFDILNGLQEAMKEKKITERDVVKVILKGYYEESSDKSTAFLLDSLSQYFYIEIEDISKLKIDINSLKMEKLSLKNEFISLVEQSETDQNIRDKIINLGIQALKGEDLTV